MALAGYGRSKGFDMDILDLSFCGYPTDKLEKDIAAYVSGIQNIDYIGITTTAPTISISYKIIRIFKKYLPGAKIIAGGAHATFMYQEVLDSGLIDIIVRGEGELTLAEILEGKKLSEINGIAYKENGIVHLTPERERITNLDLLPYPAYDLIDIKKYKPIAGAYKKLPAMLMVSTRGCAGQCSFCRRPVGHLESAFSPERMFSEIKYLTEVIRIKEIVFYDENFTSDRNKVIFFCNKLISEGMSLSWVCFSRVDSVDEALLRLMKKAGCHQIMYGAETFDSKQLEAINKRITPANIITATRLTQKAGIECRLSFIIGLPGETKTDIQNNIRHILKLNPDLIVVNIITPFPGTAMYAQAKAGNRLLTENTDDYTGATPIIKSDTLSPAELVQQYRKMYLAFYLRPSYMLRRLFSIKGWLDLGVNIKAGFAIISYALKRKKHD